MKILLCTDGSRDGLSAVHLGGAIAARMGAEVTLLCVVERKQRAVKRSLKRASKVMQKSGAVFQAVGRRGRLLEEMLTQMLAVEYDLVIAGYYVRSFLEKMVWGCAAARIAHELPASVLIVRDRRDTIKRVLIGISSGGFTERCANWGGSIAAAFGARVTLLHVGQTPPLMYAGLEEVHETLTELLQTDTLAAQALRQSAACLTNQGVQVDLKLTYGLPDRELLRAAQEQDVDLLVVGSPWAVPSVQRLFLRNITEQVLLNTRRPVLVVRPNKQMSKLVNLQKESL